MSTRFVENYAGIVYRVLFSVFLMVPAVPGLASRTETFCEEALALEPGAPATLYEELAPVQLFTVEIAQPGILMLDFEGTNSSVPPARVSFLGRGCDQVGSPRDFIELQQESTNLVVAIRSVGTYAVLVSGHDLTRPLGGISILTELIPARLVEQPPHRRPGQPSNILAQRIDLYSGPLTKSEENVVDPDPDVTGTVSTKSEENVVDPDPDLTGTVLTKSEENVVDPDPDVAGQVATRRPFLSILELRSPSAATKSEENLVDPDPDTTSGIVSNVQLLGTVVILPSHVEGMDPGAASRATTMDTSDLGAWLASLVGDDR